MAGIEGKPWAKRSPGRQAVNGRWAANGRPALPQRLSRVISPEVRVLTALIKIQ